MSSGLCRNLCRRTQIGRRVPVDVADRLGQPLHGHNRRQSDQNHQQRVLGEVLPGLVVPEPQEKFLHLSPLSDGAGTRLYTHGKSI